MKNKVDNYVVWVERGWYLLQLGLIMQWIGKQS